MVLFVSQLLLCSEKIRKVYHQHFLRIYENYFQTCILTQFKFWLVSQTYIFKIVNNNNFIINCLYEKLCIILSLKTDKISTKMDLAQIFRVKKLKKYKNLWLKLSTTLFQNVISVQKERINPKTCQSSTRPNKWLRLEIKVPPPKAKTKFFDKKGTKTPNPPKIQPSLIGLNFLKRQSKINYQGWWWKFHPP